LDNVVVIDDTYNANPASVKAGLAVLAAEQGIKLAVLGDMAELGTECAALHECVGRFAASQKIDYLFVVGEHARSVAKGFGEVDTGAVVQIFKSKPELVVALIAKVKGFEVNSAGAKPVIYVKGSRSARMEDITQQLLQWSTEAAC
jgi:UDP-N-acetylmuramoyl-tripeptide--D-alanyl-D-alanine ligase